MKEKKWEKINKGAIGEGLGLCFICSLILGFVIVVIRIILLDLFTYPEFFIPEYIHSFASFVWFAFTLSSSFGFTFLEAERRRYAYLIRIKLFENSDERLREWLKNELSNTKTFNPKDSLFPHYPDISGASNLNKRTSFNSAWLSLAVATAIILSAYFLL